jgi:hypothetical protein
MGPPFYLTFKNLLKKLVQLRPIKKDEWWEGVHRSMNIVFYDSCIRRSQYHLINNPGLIPSEGGGQADTNMNMEASAISGE